MVVVYHVMVLQSVYELSSTISYSGRRQPDGKNKAGSHIKKDRIEAGAEQESSFLPALGHNGRWTIIP